MTAQTLDGAATLRTIKAELAERVAALKARGVTPGLGTVLVGDDPGSQWYVGAKHKDCAELGIASIRARPARDRHPGRGRGRHRRAQRRPGLHRLHRPAAHRPRRVRPALAGRPRQGRRRPAPDQPRQAGARRGRTAAVHARRRHRAAASPRRADRRRRGRRGRPRPHRRSPARAAAHPPLGERDRDAVPHRHRRPRRPRAATPTSSWLPPASPASSPATWSSPARPSSTSGVSRVDGKITGDVAPDVWDVAGWVSPNPKGVGPMTRAMLLTNIVEIAEQSHP